MAGSMLRPRAWNRTVKPLASNCCVASPKAADCDRYSIMKVNRHLDCASQRQELKLVTRHHGDDTLKKFNCVLQTLCAMEWREATGKQLSHRPRWLHLGDAVLRAVLKDEYPVEPGLGYGSKCRLAVPRRAIHPEFAIVQAQDDAVVAQNLGIAHRLPQPRSCGFASTGVAEKKKSAALGIDKATAMDLDTEPVLREIVSDQQLVSGIFERPHVFGQQRGVENHFRRNEIGGAHLFVRASSDCRARKIKNEIIRLARQFPDSARVEGHFSLKRVN